MGQDMQIVHTSLDAPRFAARARSSLGALSIVASQLGIHVIAFGQTDRVALLSSVTEALLARRKLDKNLPSSLEQAEQHLEICRAALRDYFAGEADALQKLSLEPFGTSFQQRVWRQLQQIPFGSTLAYGTIAAQIDKPRAFRAVGTACGRNPIVLAIPCHRVLAAGNAIGGFSAGIERKRVLLEHEGVPGYGR